MHRPRCPLYPPPESHPRVLRHLCQECKQTKDELANMLKKNRAPPCRFEFWRIVSLQVHNKAHRFRRRGKAIVDKPFIIGSTARTQFGSVVPERPHPFGAASSDCGLAALRCNNDYKYMPKGFPPATELDQAFRCDVSQLAACFRSMQGAIKAHKSVQHMAMAVVAIHVAAKNVDFYITKYAAKPMEQLQNLVTQYALGLRRLEVEESQADQQLKAQEASEVVTLNAPGTDWKRLARRVLLRMQFSANKSKWISST